MSIYTQEVAAELRSLEFAHVGGAFGGGEGFALRRYSRGGGKPFAARIHNRLAAVMAEGGLRLPWNLTTANGIGRRRAEVTNEQAELGARMAGFIQALAKPEYAPLRRLVEKTSGPGVNSPHQVVDLWAVMKIHRSPGRAMRMMIAARRRANIILAPWGLSVMNETLAAALGRSGRVGKIALAAVAGTLSHALTGEGCAVGRRRDLGQYAGLASRYRALAEKHGVKAVRLAGQEIQRRLGWSLTPAQLMGELEVSSRMLADCPELDQLEKAAAFDAVQVRRGLMPSRMERKYNWMEGVGYADYTEVPDGWHNRRRYVRQQDADRTACYRDTVPAYSDAGGVRAFPARSSWGGQYAGDIKWYVRQGRRTYHSAASGAEQAVAEALRAWQRQATEKALTKRELPKDRTVLVWFEDSLAAGNCRPGTEQYRERKGWTSRRFIPADWLLPDANEPAVRRVLSAVLSRN